MFGKRVACVPIGKQDLTKVVQFMSRRLYDNGVVHKITDADTLVFANGYHIENDMEDMLKDAGVTYHLIGDGCKVGNIKDAITGSYELAKAL